MDPLKIESTQKDVIPNPSQRDPIGWTFSEHSLN
jgi:hypothetical protein